MMNLAEAEGLAARTLAAIDTYAPRRFYEVAKEADRERVASDLAGLRHAESMRQRVRIPKDLTAWSHVYDRHANGLRLTARLYGVH